jgi:hypothetical protein
MTKTLTSQFLLGILVLFGAIVPLVLLSVLGFGAGAMVLKVGRRAEKHAGGA